MHKKQMLKTLLNVKEMIDHAHARFNWEDSFLDAKAVRLLNEVPREVESQIKTLQQEIRNEEESD